MPQWRKLHQKITESIDVNDMPDDFHRLLWSWLSLGLDREGRGIYNPSWVKSKVMPLRMDVTLEMVNSAMEWFRSHNMVLVYQVKGRDYFVVPTFQTYQGNTAKEAESNFPPPPEDVWSWSRLSPDQQGTRFFTDSDADADTDVEEMQKQNRRTSGPPPASIYGAFGSADMRAEHIYQRVTQMLTFPASDRDNGIDAIRSVLVGRNDDEAVAYLHPYWQVWRDLRYSRTNLVWLKDWAVTGEIPDKALTKLSEALVARLPEPHRTRAIEARLRTLPSSPPSDPQAAARASIYRSV